jgi:hypothetical protein
MPAPFQPPDSSRHKIPKLLKTPLGGTSGDGKKLDDRANREAREECIGTVVTKWFGALELLMPKARASERARRTPFLQPLLQIHQLSCDLVPVEQRIPLVELDICAAIKLLNLIAITLRSKPAVIVAYCKAETAEENNLRANQLDPLLLRHLLAFHRRIPREKFKSLDIQTLKKACKKSDKNGIRTWFETIATRKSSLPKSTPQLLRQLILHLWTAGHRDFLDIFAPELAVLDYAMFDALGWENTRLFFAVLKRIHGAACRSASAFLDKGEINAILGMHKHLKDTDQIDHFHALSVNFDAETLRRLELATISAAKKNRAHIHPSHG